LRIGLLGYGAIGKRVAEELLAQSGALGNAVLVAVLVRTARTADEVPKGVMFTTDEGSFYAADWDLCVEVAGQPAVRQCGEKVLRSGRNLLVSSIGAFTDDTLYVGLQAAAQQSGSQLLLASGAMPGVDWMSSVALAGSDRVCVTQTKPPKSWLGTPAEEEFDLLSLTEPTQLFAGSAREAASKFPKNSNVAAMLAIATAGLDRTQVCLMTDPTSTKFTSRSLLCSSPCPLKPDQGLLTCNRLTYKHAYDQNSPALSLPVVSSSKDRRA
jgi:aspartate dehydrogenase